MSRKTAAPGPDHHEITAAIQKMVKVGGWELDLVNETLFWTEETYHIHDLDPEQYTPTVETAIDFYAPEWRPVITDAINQVIASGESYDLELELITAKGRRIWVHVYAAVTKKASKAIKVTGACQDITERKQAESSLSESEFIFRSLFDLGNTGLAITSPTKGWLKVNPMLSEMLAYSHEELFELTWAELTHRDDLAADVVQFERMLAGEIDNYEMEKRFIRKDGTTITVHLTVACYRVEGAVQFVIASLQDISKRKLMEQQLSSFNAELEYRVEQRTAELVAANQQLSDAKKLAEQAMEARDQFLANISHEIRTPMNGILGMVELLKLKNLNQEQKHYVQVIQRSSTTLLTVINDMLDYSKLDIEKLELLMQPFNLQELVIETAEPYWAVINDGVELEISVDPTLSARQLIGDTVRIHQILSNLLNNACKFTDQGFVAISVKGLPLANGHFRVHFTVSDSGIGIEARQQSKLFQPFTQLDQSTTRRYGGTGLGLSICQQLLSLMNSSLKLVSEPGKGSSFSFDIDLELTDNIEINAAMVPILAGQRPLRVLVAEDNPVNQLVAKKLLQSQGGEVELASDGAEAVSWITSKQRSFDLVLMDCEMPVMDGYEAATKIRNWESLTGTARIMIIALSAHAMQQHIERCNDAGMDGHLAKPLVLEPLQKFLKQIAVNGNAAASALDKN